MALFRPYEQGKRDTDEAPAPQRRGRSTGATAVTSASDVAERTASVASTEQVATAPATTKAGPRAKQGPTRSRKEAEAARMERLHPTLTKKEQRAQSRQHDREVREKRMDAIENSPGRALCRDFVDARWTLVEFMMPAMILLMALTMAGSFLTPSFITWTTVVMYVLFLAMIINVFVLWRSFKRELAARHPGEPTRGLLSYLMNRALWIRRFRRPAPRIVRGGSY